MACPWCGDPNAVLHCTCGWPVLPGPLRSAASGSPFPRVSWGDEMPGSPSRPEPAELEGEIIGYRKWVLVGHELASSNRHGYAWKIGVNKAECLRTRFRTMWGQRDELGGSSTAVRSIKPDTDHRAPHPNCDCGLYAMVKPWQGFSFLGAGEEGELVVFGAIVAWGHIELHQHGFRAEYAKVVALAAAEDEHRERVEAVASEFGVTCTRREELPDVALEHGKPVPKDLMSELAELEVQTYFRGSSLLGVGVAYPNPFAQSPVATGYAHGGYVHVPPPLQTWAPQPSQPTPRTSHVSSHVSILVPGPPAGEIDELRLHLFRNRLYCLTALVVAAANGVGPLVSDGYPWWISWPVAAAAGGAAGHFSVRWSRAARQLREWLRPRNRP